MPVASPTRYSTTSLSGSYRSSLSSSSSGEKPYYRGTYTSSTLRTSYGDRTTEYRSRYSDVDGKRERKTSLVEYGRSSRAPSVTDSDSGISTRYRSERSESRPREVSASRSECGRPAARGARTTSSALAMSAAELYDKYSPANYVPLTLRLQQQQNNYSEIARSKSISNDIGRPPMADAKTSRKPRTSAIAERPEKKYKEITPPPSYSKKNSMSNGVKDSNGNDVASVSEIRRKFDPKMTVTKLPTNDLRYTKASVEQYLNQLKECENGSSGYTKITKEEKLVPIHLPHSNGTKYGSNSSSRSNSNSDISISKTISEPVLSNPVERNGSMTTSLTSKLPSDRLASIKSQLDPNNPIGKILEKSTVITVENGDYDYKKRYSPDIKNNIKSEIEKQVKAPKHTSNFASYIQISQPVASGATKKDNSEELNNKDKKKVIKYIDDDKSNLDNDIESPSGTGFENKTFEHENFLKKRTERNEELENNHDEVKSMETSTESTISEPTEDASLETTSLRRKLEKDYEDSKGVMGHTRVDVQSKPDLSSVLIDPKILQQLLPVFAWLIVIQCAILIVSACVLMLRRHEVRLESAADATRPPSRQQEETVGHTRVDVQSKPDLSSVLIDPKILQQLLPVFAWLIVIQCAILIVSACVLMLRRHEVRLESAADATRPPSRQQEETGMVYTRSYASVPTSRRVYINGRVQSRYAVELAALSFARMELAGGKSSSSLRRSTERDTVSEVSRSERSEKSSQTSGLNGLRNIGNTCFMNSVVQCLSNTRPLLEYVVQDKYQADANTTLSCMKGALIGAFASVIKELWRSGERDSVVNTTTFKSQVQRFAPRFMGYSQQDAQEFLRYLLEGLHEDVNRVTVKPKPILTEIDDNLSDSAKATEAWSRYCRLEESRVSDIFVGQLKSTLRCTHCNHDSVTFDPFWDLSLPIPSRTGNLKIQQCLQHFTKEEEMDGDEKPTCSKCGVRRKCLKWFSIQKFPQVLVLHLKRFSPTERFRGKLNVLVEFPLTGLDMSPYAGGRTQSVTYNLYAVSNHSGTTYSGHYTAYCKHPYTGDWHEYNDSRLSPIKPRDVVSPEAYVLFYERT